LFNGIFKGVGNDSPKMTCGHARNLTLRQQFGENGTIIDRSVVIGNRFALFFLMYPTEYFTYPSCGFSFGGPTENVRAIVEYNLRKFSTVIRDQLRDALDAQYGSDIVRPSGIDYLSKPHNKDSRDFIENQS
jgi:hypothetical protein